MKFNLKYSVTALASFVMLSACEPEIDRDLSNYKEASGEADFSTYVALGNSLTAGVADRVLNRHGQLNSYPAIIADKMAAITPDFEFVQPLLPVGIASGTLEFKGLSASGTPLIVPLADGLSDEEIYAPISGRFNNMGIPGAKVGDLTRQGYGSAQGNPYFTRIASSPSATIVEDVLALDPTFFTLWIGNNDVLGYATQGGVEGGSNITPLAEFEASYKAIINQMVAKNASIEGAIANIPDVTKAPYFTTVKYNQLNLTAQQAQMANGSYSQLIDPQINAAATQGVITTVVRETALKDQIIPGVARAIVKMQIASNPPCNAAPDPAECAETYIQSGQADQQINDLRDALILNYFKPAGERDAQYAEAYLAIDAQLAINQAAIDAQTEQTFTAYQAGQLPEAQQQGLKNAIDSVTNAQILQLKAVGIYPVFAEGPNPFVIEDSNPNNPLGIRQMREGELVLLTALTGGFLTPENAALPKPDAVILDLAEVALVKSAIQEYNAVISEIAAEHTFALVDISSYINLLVTSGITENGITFTPAFVTGNTFSLDGVHLTQRGYALVAKRFIETINSYYNSNIPVPNVSNYPALALPGPTE